MATGSLTTVVSICITILVLINTSSLLALVLSYCLTKLYTNSFLASLNARGGMRDLIYSDYDSSPVQPVPEGNVLPRRPIETNIRFRPNGSVVQEADSSRTSLDGDHASSKAFRDAV